MAEPYSLGHDALELERLDRQAASLAMPTQILLEAAGLRPGMRVLDLGTGLGDVAMIAANLVTASGSVIGIDLAEDALAIARLRAEERSIGNVRFEQGGVGVYQPDQPVDAVVGRLVVFHLPEPAAAVQHHARSLAPGGLMALLDFDCAAARAEPHCPLVALSVQRIIRAFRAAGADPTAGLRLRRYLRGAGLADVTVLGLTHPEDPDDASARS